MAKITFKNFNMGGLADSDYMGGSNSYAEAVGFDIHSEVGVLKVNQAITKESGSTVDDFVKARVPCSDGNTYLFGSTNGKVWKRSPLGVYTLEATVAPAAGAVGVLDAREYQGYIYYATQSRLGRVAVGAAWSSRNDNWATFTNTDPDWHPMIELNLVLYIGDANFVAQVDAGTFSANALDLPEQMRIKCLGQLGTDLCIGTFVSSNLVSTQIYRWNTWSVSYTNSDPIPEVGINSFLPTDNYVIVNAGTKGNLYLYNGSTLEPYKRIKGSWSNTNKAAVHPNACLNFNGLPLFALSTITGTPCPMGIYSLGRANRNYPIVLNCEYGISQDTLDSLEIGCIVGVGDIFLASWKFWNGVSFEYGIDALDFTQKYALPYLVTRVIMADRMKKLNYGTVDIGYRSLPEDTEFAIFKIINGAAQEQILETVDDAQRHVFYTKVDINDASTVQVVIAPVVDGNDAPEIEVFDVNVNA